mmetsp:Transcript_3046/g.12146  ORF Transcript_3046/g.12146 Transcript_3046/m.12146 type:complete len:246 (-) Transcript_3046:422-1159(-)
MGASHQAHARADRQGRPKNVSRARAARQSSDAESVGKSLARIRRRVAERRVLPRHELHRWGVSFAHGGRSRFLVVEPGSAFDFTGLLRSQRRDEGALGGPGSVTRVGGVKDTGVSQSAGRKRVPVTRGGERVVHGALRQRVAVGDVFTSVGRDAVRADASAAFPNRARGDGAGPDDDKKELESSLRDGDDDGISRVRRVGVGDARDVRPRGRHVASSRGALREARRAHGEGGPLRRRYERNIIGA